MNKPLYVTRPMLPEPHEFGVLLEQIWQSRIVTNCGPLHVQLEDELRGYLGVATASLFNNGTIALLAALKLRDLPPGSEVLTTPLTFAATAHAIHWNGLKPVFVDVSPDTLTIDPDSVEKAITPNTSAILGVHVYGTVCDLEALQDIATRHGLSLLYDAAHAFGTQVDGRGIGTFGDASVFSFHATKLFNTLEGGMIATPKGEDQSTIHYLRNFGIKNEEEVVAIGINGKMNEVQAAIGLLNLPKVAGEQERRARLREAYDDCLGSLPGLTLQPGQPRVTRSEQYYPVVIDAEIFGRSRDDIYDELQGRDIYARKYFHPICTDFVPYRDFPIVSVRNEPYAQTVKSQVLCLPFFGEVTDEEVAEIRDVFRADHRNSAGAAVAARD